MFVAGHTYKIKTGGVKVLCVSSNTYSAAFRQQNSFSVKNHNKAELYHDLGIESFKGWIYNLLG